MALPPVAGVTVTAAKAVGAVSASANPQANAHRTPFTFLFIIPNSVFMMSDFLVVPDSYVYLSDLHGGAATGAHAEAVGPPAGTIDL